MIAATIITGLSWAGIPASLAITVTSFVIGLGWGRASRRIPLHAILNPEGFTTANRSEWVDDQLNLFDPKTTKRLVVAWVASPTVAGIIAFIVFALADRLQLIA